jgi:predicted transcriptional regulator
LATKTQKRGATGLHIPPEQSAWLDRRAEKLMISRSAVIRLLIAQEQEREAAATSGQG